MVGTIIWAIIGGAVLGVIARLILPGRQRIPWWLTVGVGMVAAFVGGVIARFFGVGSTPGIDWLKHAIQIIVAVIGIGIAASVTGKNRSR